MGGRLRDRLAGRDRERGEGMVEYVGIVTVVALLVTVSVGAVGLFPGPAATAACRVAAALTGGAGDCGGDEPVVAQPQDEDFHPGVCLLSQTSEKYSAEVKVWFIKIGESSGFIVQEFSDGTVRATLTDGAQVGASASLGSTTFDVSKVGEGDDAGVEVSLGGSLTFEYGSTWQFDDAAQWEAMKGQLDDYLIQQEQLKGEGAAGMHLWLWLSDGYVDPPKDPSITYGKTTLEAVLKGSAGTRLPGTSTDANGDPKLLDPKLGVNGSLTAGGSVVVQTNHDTGEKSYTFELSGKATLGGSVVVGHATGEGSVTGAFTTTYAEDGSLVKIAFRSAYEVGGSAKLGNDTFTSARGGMSEGESRSVVTTTTLEVTDDNRAQVEAWVDARAAGETLTLPFSAMVPDRPSDDPFAQLMYEQAKLSQVTYHNVKDGWEFGAAVKKGWEFGFSISAEEATATKAEASFLGAPGQDGTRTLVDDALCD